MEWISRGAGNVLLPAPRDILVTSIQWFVNPAPTSAPGAMSDNSNVTNAKKDSSWILKETIVLKKIALPF